MQLTSLPPTHSHPTCIGLKSHMSVVVIWLPQKLFLLRKNPLESFFAVFQDSAQLVHTIVH